MPSKSAFLLISIVNDRLNWPIYEDQVIHVMEPAIFKILVYHIYLYL